MPFNARPYNIIPDHAFALSVTINVILVVTTVPSTRDKTLPYPYPIHRHTDEGNNHDISIS